MNEQDATKAAIKRLIDRQRSAKAKITETQNKLDKARANWNSLFPIEDEENYKKAMAYIFEKRQSIKDFQDEIDKLSSKSNY